MKNTTLMEHLQIPIENRRKRLKRYPSTQIHDLSFSWLGTGTSIKCGRVKLVLLAQT